ncbi:hypothetical protein FQZ97_1219070 [compost metagenome]
MEPAGQCLAQARIGVLQQVVVGLVIDPIRSLRGGIEPYRLINHLVVVGDIECRIDPAQDLLAARGFDSGQTFVAGEKPRILRLARSLAGAAVEQ